MQIFGFWGAALPEIVRLREADPFRHRLWRCHLPQGDGFRAGRKLCGIAIRRPLGGVGERSEPEGVRSQASVLALSVKPCRACQLSQRESLWRNRKLCG